MPLPDRKRIDALEQRIDRLEHLLRRGERETMRKDAEIASRLSSAEAEIVNMKTREIPTR